MIARQDSRFYKIDYNLVNQKAETILLLGILPSAASSLGTTLRSLASAAIDISDGLISDLNHILTADGCGARISLDALPYSAAMKSQVSKEQAEVWALSGGEDYGRYALPCLKQSLGL